ncbi:hypothetical protein L9F36_004814 [Klebsiella pneumoniae]|uniref:hypothetical protein n=1 Tax=Klebsiella pneumoniae TaxID=573 RepID=UPI001C7E5958|nr:hypothetical protein [Klebsiella pneumoniae]EKV3389262.1 hypothetical protein [Klebsiella pneumoniae]EKW6173460.1 hypothetical protein [Klebsiella pneumoniae]MBX4594042.1 hypothetical protein [Klebsiella pneumoniae]HBX3292179.1 hypothetical protein [Klebsiella pneumoniae]
MDLVLFSFNINVFTQHAILKPESRSVMKLMPFIEDGFFPSHGDAFNNNSGSSSKVLKVDKEMDGCRLSVIFSLWSVNIIIESPVFLEQSRLITKIEYLFSLINDSFVGDNILGNRLAAILTIGLKHSDEVDSHIYHKYLKGNEIPFEWSVRQAYSCQLLSEEIFNIVNITKGNATISYSGKVFEGDAIVINIDNNTQQKNTNKRFSFKDTSFLKELVSKTFGDYLSVRGE